MTLLKDLSSIFKCKEITDAKDLLTLLKKEGEIIDITEQTNNGVHIQYKEFLGNFVNTTTELYKKFNLIIVAFESSRVWLRDVNSLHLDN